MNGGKVGLPEYALVLAFVMIVVILVILYAGDTLVRLLP